jgi:hypothetical protein
MNTEELAFNLLRQVQAEACLRRDGISTATDADRVHHLGGTQVHRFIIDLLFGTPLRASRSCNGQSGSVSGASASPASSMPRPLPSTREVMMTTGDRPYGLDHA